MQNPRGSALFPDYQTESSSMYWVDTDGLERSHSKAPEFHRNTPCSYRAHCRRRFREARVTFALPCLRCELQNRGIISRVTETHNNFVSVSVACKLVVKVRSVQVFGGGVHSVYARRHDSRDVLVISPVRAEIVDRGFLQRFADMSSLLPFRRDDNLFAKKLCGKRIECIRRGENADSDEALHICQSSYLAGRRPNERERSSDVMVEVRNRSCSFNKLRSGIFFLFRSNTFLSEIFR